jgi:hypothetical protein
MATIAPTTSIVQQATGQFLYTTTWANMQFGDVGAPVSIGDVIKSANCLMDSNDGGENLSWEASSDGSVFTVIPVIGVTDPLYHWPTYVRPHITGSYGAAITATLTVYRTYR